MDPTAYNVKLNIHASYEKEQFLVSSGRTAIGTYCVYNKCSCVSFPYARISIYLMMLSIIPNDFMTVMNEIMAKWVRPNVTGCSVTYLE